MTDFTGEEKLHVVKRNKEFKSGDFIVFIPSHRRQENEYDGVPLQSKLVEMKDVHPAEERSVLESLRREEKGKYVAKLQRSPIYEEGIRRTFAKTRCDNCERATRRLSLVNVTGLNDFHKNEDAAVDGFNLLTVDQLRLLLMAEHVGRLLKANRCNVKFIKSQTLEIVSDFINERFGIDFKRLETTDDDSGESVVQVASDRGSQSDWFKALLVKCNNNQYGDRSDGKREEISLDLRKFISTAAADTNGYRKNLTTVTLCEDSELTTRLYNLELHRSKVEQLMNCDRATPALCLNVTSYDQEFLQYQTMAAWQTLEPDTRLLKQVYVVCGPVSNRLGAQRISMAHEFFSLRIQQMKDAFIMKYGNDVKGDGWQENIVQLAKAAIKFELLSTGCRSEVKLDLSTSPSSAGGSPVDGKGGVFVMYNCARLATLFRHFEESISKGVYPPLPDLEDVDFSLLKQEEEWELLFNYVILFPSVVRETIVGMEKSTAEPIQTHKICQFLLSLSNTMSRYYSKTHILIESRSHLMPLMFARLYLMKAIQAVMHDGLSLLGIEPCTQL